MSSRNDNGSGRDPVAPLMWLARTLVRLAAHLMPPSRADWARAMHAEFEHAVIGGDALKWASGCVLAAFAARVASMKLGTLMVSRWVLLPEVLLCFLAPTLALWGGAYFMVEVAQLDAVHAHKFWHGGAPGGAVVLGTLFVATVLSVAGPLGLGLGGYYLVRGGTGGPRWLYGLLLGCSLGTGVAQIVGRLANGKLMDFSPAADSAFDFYAGLILLSVLPALAALHLRRLPVAVSG